jgi:hypothetical protein
MNFWDVLNNITKLLPPITVIVILVTAAFIFLLGFSRRGLNFIKYGFGQPILASSLETRLDELAEKMATKDDLSRMATKDDLNRMATKDDLNRMATKDDLNRMATKDDLNKLKDDISLIDAKIGLIETNHFGHLKSYLGLLNGILLDKGIVNHEMKARLDNEIRYM